MPKRLNVSFAEGSQGTNFSFNKKSVDNQFKKPHFPPWRSPSVAKKRIMKPSSVPQKSSLLFAKQFQAEAEAKDLVASLSNLNSSLSSENVKFQKSLQEAVRKALQSSKGTVEGLQSSWQNFIDTQLTDLCDQANADLQAKCQSYLDQLKEKCQVEKNVDTSLAQLKEKEAAQQCLEADLQSWKSRIGGMLAQLEAESNETQKFVNILLTKVQKDSGTSSQQLTAATSTQQLATSGQGETSQVRHDVMNPGSQKCVQPAGHGDLACTSVSSLASEDQSFYDRQEDDSCSQKQLVVEQRVISQPTQKEDDPFSWLSNDDDDEWSSPILRKRILKTNSVDQIDRSGPRKPRFLLDERLVSAEYMLDG